MVLKTFLDETLTLSHRSARVMLFNNLFIVIN